MHLFQILFTLLLILTTGYSAIFGGWTGKGGAAIFWAASLSTMVVGNAVRTWTTTAVGVMLIDVACMLALAILAFVSKRNWPIWALGFQIACVATHVTTLVGPTFWPRAYYWMIGVWSLPILVVMVVGTRLDRIEDASRPS